VWTWRWTKELSGADTGTSEGKSGGAVAQARSAWAGGANLAQGENAVDGGQGLGLPRRFFPFPKRPATSMPIEIKIRKNEPIDRAIRRMKKKLDRENIIKGVRANRYYEKPCERRRRKNKVQAFTQMLRRRYAE